MEKNEIILYTTSDGKINVEVMLQSDTIWLTQKAIAELFCVDRSVITKHLNNIFRTSELQLEAVCAKNAHTASDGKVYETNFYNLDAIISVGYRVNSKNATQFRIWATDVLKRYLITGYAVNQQKLEQQAEQLKELQKTISLISDIAKNKPLSGNEAEGLLTVLAKYSEALNLLDKYDYQQLELNSSSRSELYHLEYKEGIELIDKMRVLFNASELFGREKDGSFSSSLMSVYQTFDGKDLYPSVEEKAANLLYFLVKNHSFSDGNKRIAAALFIWFLYKNKMLINPDGEQLIDNKTMVALTLMIAESHPNDKDMMIKVVVNLLS
jgi:prophage maintenance system killer protein